MEAYIGGERMNKTESLTEYAKGMAKFREQLKQPTKDANNPFFKSKYVELEGVQKAIDDALVGTGITYQQFPEVAENGHSAISTVVMHDSGEYILFPPYSMPADKQTPQGHGSTLTYLRRYTLSAIFGVSSDKDDDGNKASENAPSYKQRIDDAYAAIQKVGKMNKTQVDQLVKDELNIQSLSKVTDSDRFQTLSKIYRNVLKNVQNAEKNQGAEQTSLMDGNTITPKGDK